MELNSSKLLICVRHGERTDFAGLTPVLGKYDPELTKRGEEQAYKIGEIIRNKLTKISTSVSINKIMLCSSPFARTLQTSKNILKALLENESDACSSLSLSSKIINEILVQNLLCEYINEELSECSPKDYLAIYNNNEFLLDNLNGVKISFINDKEVLPTQEESREVCFERLKKCADYTIENYSKNEEIDVVILVSHGTPLDYINQALGYEGPHGWQHIQYCDAFVYSLEWDLDIKIDESGESVESVESVNNSSKKKTTFREKLQISKF